VEVGRILLAAKGFLSVPNAALFFKKMLDLRDFFACHLFQCGNGKKALSS
jgi:hypothetical protein